MRLDIVAMHDTDRVKIFSALMQSISSCLNMSPFKSWSIIQESINLNALESFKKKTHANKDCFKENINVLIPLINAKRQAHNKEMR